MRALHITEVRGSLQERRLSLVQMESFVSLDG